MQNEIDEIEVSIKAAKEKVTTMKSLDRLLKNKDFKTVIDTGYFQDEAVRLVHLKADFQMQSPEQQDFIIRGMDSIGNLRAYFSKIYQQGNAAINAMNAAEEAREEILSESVING